MDVEYLQPGDELALLTPELRAEKLVTGAHGEDHRALFGRRVQAPVGAQPPGGQDLRQVLAAAEQVDVALPGHRLVGIDQALLHFDPRSRARRSKISRFPGPRRC